MHSNTRAVLTHGVGRGVDALRNKGQIAGAGGTGGDWESIYENDQSDKVRDAEKASALFKMSSEITLTLSYTIAFSRLHFVVVFTGDGRAVAIR
jgi:hypothetical protein